MIFSSGRLFCVCLLGVLPFHPVCDSGDDDDD